METVQLVRTACGRRWSPGDRFKTRDNYIGTIISILRDETFRETGNRHEFYIDVKWDTVDFAKAQPLEILTKAGKLRNY